MNREELMQSLRENRRVVMRETNITITTERPKERKEISEEQLRSCEARREIEIKRERRELEEQIGDLWL